MKKRNFIVSGLSALAIMVAFTQCDGNKAANTTSDNSTPAESVSDLKIAYVEIDSLLNNYNLCKDLNEAMIKKQENVEVTLKEKMKSLDNEMRDFERKYQNHVFTPERAQQEQNRLIKKRQDLEASASDGRAPTGKRQEQYPIARFHQCLSERIQQDQRI